MTRYADMHVAVVESAISLQVRFSGTFFSVIQGELMNDTDEKPRKIHLADRRRAVTVCGAVVSAYQIGTYAESILLLGDKTIVRREVFSGIERVRRSMRCKACFRRVGKVL